MSLNLKTKMNFKSLLPRLLKLILCLFVTGVIIKLLIWLLAPKGYSGGECMTPLYDIRKSENLLAVFTAVAKQQNFTWWLEYGALLGTIRGGMLMAHDKDIDAAFMYHDIAKFYSLQDHLKPYGIERFGFTYVFTEDYIVMQEPGGGEKVSAKLEFYPVIVSGDDHIVRTDLLPYVDQNRRAQKSFGEQVWWLLLRWTGAAYHTRRTIHPLTTAPLKRYFPPSDEIYQKMKARLPKKKNPDGKTLELFEVDESNEEELREWSLDVPVPADSRLALEVIYGPTWQKEIKWKVNCYV